MDFKRAVSEEEGSATLEFLGMVPLVFMVMMIAWQFVVGVHGVIVAQSAVNEAAKVYSITGEWTEARAAAQSTVNPISYLQLKSADTAMTLEEQGCQQLMAAGILIFYGIGNNVFCDCDQLVDLDHGQIGNIHQIFHYFAPFTAR